jgi:hypothetical protein
MREAMSEYLGLSSSDRILCEMVEGCIEFAVFVASVSSS